MKQNTNTTIILFMLTVTLLVGCDKESPKPQAVVMNIGTISEATGIKEEIKIRTEAINQQFSENMKALSAEHRKEIEDEKANFSDSPSEEYEKKIQTLQEQLRERFIVARNEKKAKLAKEISEFRQSHFDEIMSVAQIIALEHGASIILKAGGVFWSDGSADITDEVVERMSGENY
ncbi:MAG: OmpH family outer membrane protein [Pseudomonadota bacterium]